MAEEKSERCPKEFLNKEWIYVNTILAKGGDPSLFLEYCDMKKIPFNKEIKNNYYGTSVHPILVKANEEGVEIDFYRSWNSDNSSTSFQIQYGAILTRLLQTGFNTQEMEIKRDEEIIKKGNRKNLRDKLAF